MLGSEGVAGATHSERRMMKRAFAAGLATGLVTLVSAAVAQDDEIIVTASRRSAFESDIVPVIHLKRRADFLVAEAVVESDSREAKTRLDEVLKTLEAMAARAERDDRIELGIQRTFELPLSDEERQKVLAAVEATK